MSNFVLDRKVIVKKILDNINTDYNQEDIKTAMKSWWTNIRENGGLRLSHTGSIYFSMAGLTHWDIDITKNKNLFKKAKYQILLGTRLPTPFYLHSKTTPYIRIYDSRIVVLINLHGGLLPYLDTLSQIKK